MSPGSARPTCQLRPRTVTAGQDGVNFADYMKKNGIIPGIKVDKGTKPLPFSPGETITEGLDGLRERLIQRGVPGYKISVVPNGVAADFSGAAPPAACAAIAARGEMPCSLS